MTAIIHPRGQIINAALIAEPVPLSQEWLIDTGVTLTGTSVGTRLEMAELPRLHALAPLTIDHRTTRLV